MFLGRSFTCLTSLRRYVEMVEEANEYYKNGIHRMYELFKDAPIFKELRDKYGENGKPTAQEIARSSGVPSINKPHERGLEDINQHLAEQSKPMLVRKGEWDRVQSFQSDSSPPSSSAASSPASSPRMSQRTGLSPTDVPRSSSFAMSTPNSPTILQTSSRKSSGASLASLPRHSMASSAFHIPPSAQKPKKHGRFSSNSLSLAMPNSNDALMEATPTSIVTGVSGRPTLSPSMKQSPLQFLQQSSKRAYAPPSYNVLRQNHHVQALATSSVGSNSGTVCLADLDLNQHPMDNVSNSTIQNIGSITMESQLFGTDLFPSIVMGDGELESMWTNPFRATQPNNGAQEAGI